MNKTNTSKIIRRYDHNEQKYTRKVKRQTFIGRLLTNLKFAVVLYAKSLVSLVLDTIVIWLLQKQNFNTENVTLFLNVIKKKYIKLHYFILLTQK